MMICHSKTYNITLNKQKYCGDFHPIRFRNQFKAHQNKNPRCLSSFDTETPSKRMKKLSFRILKPKGICEELFKMWFKSWETFPGMIKNMINIPLDSKHLLKRYLGPPKCTQNTSRGGMTGCPGIHSASGKKKSPILARDQGSWSTPKGCRKTTTGCRWLYVSVVHLPYKIPILQGLTKRMG